MKISKFGFRISLASLALLSLHLPLKALAIEALVPTRPTDNLSLTLSAIQSARKSLRVNIYQLSAPPIVEALRAKIAAGLDVEILAEGQPVGGLAEEERAARDILANAYSERTRGVGFFREMSSREGGKRRFHFNHAKYVVVDETSLLIGSENYTDTGNPGANQKGNRGWETIVNDETLSNDFLNLFDGDSDTRFGDVLEVAARNMGDSLKATFPGIFTIPGIDMGATKAAPLPAPEKLEISTVSQVVAPTTSLSGLTKLLRSARESIDLEQMTFASTWDRGAEASPLLDEVLAAARRGVKVRVLLNDEAAFGKPKPNAKPTPNVVSYRLLNNIAKGEELDLEARIANVEKMQVTYIHNKGALVDGKRVLISSINWNQNSVTENRETAVVLEGAGVFAYHEDLFAKDWQASAP